MVLFFFERRKLGVKSPEPFLRWTESLPGE